MEYNDFSKLEKDIGLCFNNKKLLRCTFIHKSFNHETDKFSENYERMEFLGDAVIGLIIGEYLYKSFPSYTEGKLSQIKASLISELTLAKVAEKLNLGEYMVLGKGEDLSGGRQKSSLLADVFEALVAAIYLDRGLRCAKRFVLNQLSPIIEDTKKGLIDMDYKSEFQEVAQEILKDTPVYRVVREKGPDHDRNFTVEVLCYGEVYGVGAGKGKKEAEQMAAKNGLQFLRKKLNNI